jgi:hypothetical protein
MSPNSRLSVTVTRTGAFALDVMEGSLDSLEPWRPAERASLNIRLSRGRI